MKNVEILRRLLTRMPKNGEDHPHASLWPGPLCFALLMLMILASGPGLRAVESNRLRLIATNRFEITAGPGSTYQLQQSHSLHPAPAWQNVGTPSSVLTPGTIIWTFSVTNAESYFRVEIRTTPGTGLSQAEAESLVTSQIIRPAEQTNLVLGLRWPSVLPTGAAIEPISNSEEAPDAWTANERSYLFVIDHAPSQKLAHPYTYVLVGSDSGTMRIIQAFSPPIVEGASHFGTFAARWNASARFFPTNFATAPDLANSFSLVFPPEPEGLAAAHASTADSILVALADAGSGTNTAQLTVNCTNVVGKKVAVVIASGSDDEIQNDARDMSALLTRLGFQVTDLNSSSNSLSQTITMLSQAGQGLGPCDKFFVYLSSHTQLVDDNDDGKPDGTPTRLDYGLGHTNKSKWAWLPGRPGTLPTLLQGIPAGRLNLMMDTCYSEALAVLMRKNKTQPPPGCEWNIFASSSPTNTSAGATELDLLLDYANNEVHSAYTDKILKKVTAAADANQIDKNGDGTLSIDEIEQSFLEAQFAVEGELSNAQQPHFDRFIGAVPIAVNDTFIAPPGQVVTNKTALNDTVVSGTQFVLVDPPALHADLYTWNPQTGEMTLTGLTTVSQVTFRYKLVAGPYETAATTVTIQFDPRMNFAPEFLAAGPDKVRVPCLILDGLHYPIYQFRLVNNPADVCKEPHWHSNREVFQLDVLSGPGRNDPDPPSCGYDTVKQVQTGYFEVSNDVWQDFLIDHIPPIP